MRQARNKYLGGLIPNLLKTSGYKRGKTTISLSESTWLWRPPTLENLIFMSISIGATSARLEPVWKGVEKFRMLLDSERLG